MANPNPSPNTRFQSGQKADPSTRGEIKRGKDTISKAFLKAIVADFDKHGETAIQTLRTEDIGTYCRLAASFVPKELEVIGPFDGLDSDTIARLVAGLDALLAREIGGGASAQGGPEPLSDVQPLH